MEPKILEMIQRQQLIAEKQTDLIAEQANILSEQTGIIAMQAKNVKNLTELFEDQQRRIKELEEWKVQSLECDDTFLSSDEIKKFIKGNKEDYKRILGDWRPSNGDEEVMYSCQGFVSGDMVTLREYTDRDLRDLVHDLYGDTWLDIDVMVGKYEDIIKKPRTIMCFKNSRAKLYNADIEIPVSMLEKVGWTPVFSTFKVNDSVLVRDHGELLDYLIKTWKHGDWPYWKSEQEIRDEVYKLSTQEQTVEKLYPNNTLVVSGFRFILSKDFFMKVEDK